MLQTNRLHDPYPLTWEIPTAVFAGSLLALVLGAQVGRSLANLAAGTSTGGAVSRSARHHVQWQQKLARSVQISRASNGGQPKRDVNSVSEPDSHIPRGFRG